ncbi:MAG TPA: hypothetical protein VHX16_07620 [Chloroflexota bacterium]|nr:hypothetical protein [Chloroflexota bacterium]
MTTIEAVINPMIPVHTLVGLMPILLVVDVVTTGPRLPAVDELLSLKQRYQQGFLFMHPPAQPVIEMAFRDSSTSGIRRQRFDWRWAKLSPKRFTVR